MLIYFIVILNFYYRKYYFYDIYMFRYSILEVTTHYTYKLNTIIKVHLIHMNNNNKLKFFIRK